MTRAITAVAAFVLAGVLAALNCSNLLVITVIIMGFVLAAST